MTAVCRCVYVKGFKWSLDDRLCSVIIMSTLAQARVDLIPL